MPLVILVCGTACVGKSTIATQLAQRLNLPNVLQVITFPSISWSFPVKAICLIVLFSISKFHACRRIWYMSFWEPRQSMLSSTTVLLFLFAMLWIMKIYHNELVSHAQLTISAPLASIPVWARDYSSPEELITEFCRECRIVRKGNLSDPFLGLLQFYNFVPHYQQIRTLHYMNHVIRYFLLKFYFQCLFSDRS